jgi:hypothetical protein
VFDISGHLPITGVSEILQLIISTICPKWNAKVYIKAKTSKRNTLKVIIIFRNFKRMVCPATSKRPQTKVQLGLFMPP